MFRPIGIYTLILSVIILLFSKFKLKRSLLLFLGWFLIVCWWLLRNYLLTGFVFFHTLPGKHFLNHTASYVVMKSEGISYNQAKEKLGAELSDKIKQLELGCGKSASEIEQCIIAEKLAFKHIKSHPFWAAQFSINNILKTAFTPFSEELFFIEEKINNGGCINIFQRIKIFLSYGMFNKWLVPIVFFDIILFLVLWIGFVGFIIISFWNRSLLLQLLKVLPFITLFIFITLASGFARLRMPAEPLLIMLSGFFWIRIFKREL